MTTAGQILLLLFCGGALSGLTLLLYKVLCLLRVAHFQRVLLIKTGLLSIWSLPLAALLLPQSNVGRAVGALIPLSSGRGFRVMAAQGAVLPFGADGLPLTAMGLWVYLIGATFMLAQLVWSLRQAYRIVAQSRRADHLGRQVFINDHIESPFSFGLLRPKIFFPSGFIGEQSQTCLEAVLAHEEIHIENGDPRWKVFSLLTRAILFFSPFSHTLDRLFELEMEMTCDQETMGRTGGSVRDYGNLLLDVATGLREGQPNLVLTYMTNTTLKRRITAMKTHTKSRPLLLILLGGALALASVAGTALAFAQTKSKSQYFVKGEIFLDGKLVSTPQFVVLDGEPAELEMKSKQPEQQLKMTLQAWDAADVKRPDGVRLRIQLEYKNTENLFRADQQVIVQPHQETLLPVAANFELRVVAERQ